MTNRNSDTRILRWTTFFSALLFLLLPQNVKAEDASLIKDYGIKEYVRVSKDLPHSEPLVLFLTPTESFNTSGGNQLHEANNWVSGEGAIYTIPAGTGKPGITSISFPTQSAQYIRIIQTGTDAKYNWSICELNVLGQMRLRVNELRAMPRYLLTLIFL